MTEFLEFLRALINDPFAFIDLPIRQWITDAVSWIVSTFRGFSRTWISPPVQNVMNSVQWMLSVIPPGIFLLLTLALGWWSSSWRVGVFAAGSLAFIGFLGVWDEMIITLSLVVTAVFFCIVIGLPLGIIGSRSERFYTVMRPILDIMQTTPPFVYLVPAVMLFSIGNVPGLIATIIFAMPPIIRLTYLGIRNVNPEFIEAASAFGSTRSQTLWKVQFPLALPTIMAGLNQTIMLSLSMVVIAAIIGAGGLGLEVYAGLERLNIGQAFVGGIGIVLLAMVLDRITQGLGDKAPGVKYKSD
ncbi:glycine betaine/proline transport system permease protein [Ectothiorhodosinus mongolicus]|uniref:Glycine betaine/proline transport system permease protein n=1 Tax=Ectothiorhodosinus mongolicus TaxID=233100 RepID=A0A1R3W605_9GAMM|nr:proline/glycine betaine ABC transporter permease [Ectothiorhodosinus mongolicus]ULX57597.1 glycine/betaine ABC transporter permease [Ectothiorhodosinus mongolicus]SIT73016.1 glycine betaine/proline transport system permease protein [Ectothiorhodosinus mongolicus]